MTHARAVARLRLVVKSVWASLPRDARRVLNGTTVQVGYLGHSDRWQKREGIAFKNGRLIVLDRDFLTQAEERDIELVLAHELSHIYRTRIGQHDEDDAQEELGAAHILKSWGFRERQNQHAPRTRNL